MPSGKYKSVAVPPETYALLQQIAAEWGEQLQVSLSVGATITRLAKLHEQNKTEEVVYNEK